MSEQTAKILRKIKATLQHRKSKSRQKAREQQNTVQGQGGAAGTTTTAAAVSEHISRGAPPEQRRAEELSVGVLAASAVVALYDDGCDNDDYDYVSMESNINRVLNQNVRHTLNGQLCKYTNVMKGWQYRWFTVDSKTGTLSYFLCDSSAVGDDIAPSPHVLASAPRGQVHLAGAVVCPSDEDSRTFSIGCASGDTLKLRASDARARQEWVDGLRAVVESHTKAMDISNSSPLPPRELLAASDAMASARQALYLTEQCNASLARAIENIDCSAFTPTDPDLLLLKAISSASTQCLHQCLSLLQRHQEINQPTPSSVH